MSVRIEKDGFRREIYGLTDRTSFSSRQVDLPDNVAAAVQRLFLDFTTVQLWLKAVYEGANRRDFSPEVSDEIRRILWLEDENLPLEPTPEELATEADSSTESPKTSSEEESPSLTKKRRKRSPGRRSSGSTSPTSDSPTESSSKSKDG